MLNIYDSLSKQKSEFKPVHAGKVGMYVCGVTVYDYCHIGHARLLVSFDIINRHLLSLGYEVNYVRNITDVDDKIFARAEENGEDFRDLSKRFTDLMHEDERSLNILPVNKEPRATEHMPEIITLIKDLIEKGFAYQGSNGDVFFALDKYKEYGKLSRRKIEDLLVGDRIEVETAKKNPLDFVLWKMAKPGEAFWTSPWGDGRPGWHIECSAMSLKAVGKTLDIHGGATDLVFPHHENEIAQSECSTGQELANNWMHCGVVRVKDEKMSKSLGNFFTIRDVLKEYHHEIIRYFLSTSHYRSPISYSESNLQLAKTELSKFYQALRGLSFETADSESSLLDVYKENFDAAMNDDFNVPKAIVVMFDLLKKLTLAEGEDELVFAKGLVGFGQRLGFLYEDAESFFTQGDSDDAVSTEKIEALIQGRKEARANKDWARADEIRDELDALNIVLEDGDGKTLWKRK